MSSSGGKAPGSSGAWGVLQTGETGGDEAFTPEANGVSITVEFGGDVLIVGLVVLGGAEDEAAAEDEGLRSGAGADQRLELAAGLVGEYDG